MRKGKGYIFTLTGIFLLSMSLFIYEVLLTRLFSTMLLKHLVFFIISLAILGIGIGGFIAYRIQGKIEYEKLTPLTGVSYIVITVLIYKLPYIEFVGFYMLIAGLPFVIGGLILSLVLLNNNQLSSKIYFVDLLGSTIGSILLVKLMDDYGFMVTLFIIGILGLTSSLMFALSKSLKRFSMIIVGLQLLLMTLILQENILQNFENKFTGYFKSPITVVEQLSKLKGSEVEVLYSKWDSISRTDVVEGNHRQKIILTDGGASAPMMKFNGDLKEVDFLKNGIEFLPFTIGNNEDTLIVGSGGGKDILLALLGGSLNIDAVEINPSTIDAANKFKDFNGDIYNHKAVSKYIDDGRNFVEKTNKKYNNIYLSMVKTNTVNNIGLGMSENYIYTKEAFRTYFDHLKDDGYLSFMFHDALDIFKAINTGIEVLLDLGVKREDISDHFIVVNGVTMDSIEAEQNAMYAPIIVFKKNPYTHEEIKNINTNVKKQNRKVENLPRKKYIDLYHSYSKGELELSNIYDGIPFNTVPATDDKPFFFNYDKNTPLPLLVLPGIIILVTFGMYLRLRTNLISKSIIYFALIGLGFMLIEIPLIQKSMLFLGNPTKSFSYILFSLLLSCGIGAYFSDKKIFDTKIRYRSVIFILIPILVIFSQFSIPFLIKNYRNVPDTIKLLLLSITLFPLGFFLGMPFPKGIARLNLFNKKQYIPLIWGINGIMSVAGSAIGLAVSMKFGFNSANLLGGMIYLSIFIFNL